MNPLDDTLNAGATLPRQHAGDSVSTDTLNVGATLPRPSQDSPSASSASGDDLENMQTIRLPGAGSMVFGRYRLQRVLGRGGMGVVWLAVDTKLERAVALKFLPDIVGADPAALKELKDETRRGLELAHPNIVRIYDFVDSDEAAAISMEFVDGKSLSERRLGKPHKVFSVEELAPWVAQMCDALDYAHIQKRIVHRDLKPANLMVNSESEIKITDFGIARSVSDTMSRVSRGQHGTSGTLLYMSPQQAMGERPRPTDDVYALGATIYELLGGKPPFYTGDISMQITARTAPSVKERREELEIGASDEIPKVWEEAIAACLDKDPAKRPQTAGEFARRLGVSSRREPDAAPVKTKAGGLKQVEVTPAAKEQPKAKKSPVLAIVLVAVALLMLLAAVGIGGLWWWWHRPGSWIVTTQPAGAHVTVDGRSAVSPATLAGLKPGKYTASLSLDGYEPKEISVDVAAGQKVELGAVPLERSMGSLALSSEPKGAAFEVRSATDEKAQPFKGLTPETLRLPIGKYSVTMKHGGEIKTNDVSVARNDSVQQSFTFPKPQPPPDPAPVVASTLPAAPTTPTDTPPAPLPATSPAPGIADAPPASMPAVPSSPPAGSSAQALAAAALAGNATAIPGAPTTIPAAGGDGTSPSPNMAAIAAQVDVGTPQGGYWKLGEIFSHSSYSEYSHNGRGYVLYKAQAALKEQGFYKSGIDASPGPGTHKAIQDFQSSSALQPNGQLDDATLAALGLGGLPDKRGWGEESDGDRTPESEKTAFRKFIEKNALGGQDLKEKTKQIGRGFKNLFNR